jgi:hypothetical protein
MRVVIKDKNGKVLGVWVAKTRRGLNKTQRAQISKVRNEHDKATVRGE